MLGGHRYFFVYDPRRKNRLCEAVQLATQQLREALRAVGDLEKSTEAAAVERAGTVERVLARNGEGAEDRLLDIRNNLFFSFISRVSTCGKV